MLVEMLAQLVGSALLDLAVREVAAPAAKKLLNRTTSSTVHKSRSGAAAADADRDVPFAPRLSPVRSVHIVSETPGRLRLQVDGVQGHPDLANKILADVAAIAGVHKVVVSAHTGRLLVQFTPTAQTVASIVAGVDRARARHLPIVQRPARRLAAIV